MEKNLRIVPKLLVPVVKKRKVKRAEEIGRRKNIREAGREVCSGNGARQREIAETVKGRTRKVLKGAKQTAIISSKKKINSQEPGGGKGFGGLRGKRRKEGWDPGREPGGGRPFCERVQFDKNCPG